MICLDTNIAIYVINRRVPAVRLRLAEQLRLGTEISLSAIALFELRYGHARSDRRARTQRPLARVFAPGGAGAPFRVQEPAPPGRIPPPLGSKGTPRRPSVRP